MFGATVGALVICSIGAFRAVPIGSLMILMGSFLAAAGASIEEDGLVLVGHSIIGGIGCAMLYIGPQFALTLWFPEMRSFVAAISVTGFSVGPLAFTGVVHHLEDQIDYIGIDVFYVALGLLPLISTLCAIPSLKGPRNVSHPFKYIIAEFKMPEGPSVPVYVSLRGLLSDFFRFYLPVTTFALVTIPSGGIPAFIIEAAFASDSLKPLDYTPVYALLQIYFLGTLVGRIAGGLLVYVMDMQLLSQIIIVFQISICTAGNDWPLFNSNESVLHPGTGMYLFVYAQGMVFGIISGSIQGYIQKHFGLFLLPILHGLALTIAGFVALGLLVATKIIASEGSNVAALSIFRSACIALCVTGLVTGLGINIDPDRMLLDQIQPRSSLIFSIASNWELHLSLTFGIRFVSRQERKLLLETAIMKNEETVRRIIDNVPRQLEDIPWIFFGIEFILTSSFLVTLIVTILLYTTPFFVLVFEFDPNNQSIGNFTCQVSSTAKLEADRELVIRFGVYSLCAIVSAYIGIAMLIFELSRSFAGAIRNLSNRIRDPEDFVFGSSTNLELCLIREIHVCTRGTNTLRRSVLSFGHFVPETIVRKALRDEKYRRPYGEKSIVTILFLQVPKLAASLQSLGDELLGQYYSLFADMVSTVIESNQGVISELLDDGVLAFWNTPEVIDNPNMQACQCALDLVVMIQKLSIHLSIELSFPPLKCEIGINSGVVTTGIIGVSNKMKFGAIGDAMNLASRLKGLCKVFGVTIVVADEAKPDRMCMRPLQKVKVAGKSHAVLVYQAIGRFENVECEQLKMVQMYSKALEEYQLGNFKSCISLVEPFQTDHPCRRLLNKANGNLALFGNDLSTWNHGVETFTSK